MVVLLAASPGYGWLSSNLSPHLLRVSKLVLVVIINIIPYTLQAISQSDYIVNCLHPIAGLCL